MSSTNLTNGRDTVYFFMVNPEKNHLKSQEKPGDASKVKPEDAKDLSISLGVSDMVIPARNLALDKQGHRENGSQRQDMESIDYKIERMERINAEKSQENTRHKDPEKIVEKSQENTRHKDPEKIVEKSQENTRHKDPEITDYEK